MTDYLNHRIRRINRSGRIVTIVGGHGPGHDGDGGPAVEARLHKPSGVAFGPDGDMYITEHENHAVRRVDRRGRVTTIAGANGRGFGGDGGRALDAAFNWPSGIAVAGDGSIYVADRNNDVIRRLVAA